jgi:hypothetical protein
VGGERKMNLRALAARLAKGEALMVRYEYPSKIRDENTGSIYRVRTDRLLDVAPVRKKLFVSFGGQVPIWIEAYEAIEVTAAARKSAAA